HYIIHAMLRSDDWRNFVAMAVVLPVAGPLRSAWATRLDGFTVDEPWHITAAVAYLRTGEYFLNPEHPPLIKLLVALPLTQGTFHSTEPGSLHDKREERDFVQAVMYTQNEADSIHTCTRRSMYFFNGFLLIFFAISAFRVFGGVIALGSLVFLLMDPTV